MTAALSVAAASGFEWVACASTGNTSAAMSAYAARAGLKSLVLIPEGKIAWGKLSQSMDYGALTVQLRTDFDGCVRVLGELIRRAPVYLLNSVNPYRLEGQKTPAFEMLEQMDWRVPDHVIVPGGNLANSSALGKGFAELKQLGFTRRVPRISVVQAEGANPLYRAMRANGGTSLEAVVADTRASAIRIGNPASWRKAVKVLLGNRRMVRTGERGGDCAGEGRDRRGGHRVRTCIGSDACGTKETGGGRTCRSRGDGCPAADRSHAKGSGVHPAVPPGRVVPWHRPGRRGRRDCKLAVAAGTGGTRSGGGWRSACAAGDCTEPWSNGCER